MSPTILQLIALLGILLSIYLLYVERKFKKNKSYKAICDIIDKISCTKVTSSRFDDIMLLDVLLQ